MYLAGWSKTEIAITPQGYAMHGFGNPKHKALGVRNPLQARSFYIAEADNPASHLIYVCLDLGYVTHAMREQVVARLQQELAHFDEERLVLTCTHTHSGPGGCTQDGLYNLVTPGYQPQHVVEVVRAAVATVLEAQKSAQPTTLFFSSQAIDDEVDVAWNRSLAAYNRNLDVAPCTEEETHKAIDRTMHLVEFRRGEQTQALISLFGVHATCLGSDVHNHDGDNKGYAALFAEQQLAAEGVENPVAIFAQGTCGDVSPHYQGPGAAQRRKQLKGEAVYQYAEANGRKQSDHAFAMLTRSDAQPITGPLDGVLTYQDMGRQHAAPEFANGEAEAFTTPPCHGVAFFQGTPIDGPGMPGFLGLGAKIIARRVKQRRLADKQHPKFEYYQRLYASQGPKDVLMESERKRVLGFPFAKIPLPSFADPLVRELKKQARAGALNKSAMVPSVLPLQIVRLGNITLTCAPGEFTTIAGRRLLKVIEQTLGESEQHIMCTYSNDYMGYVTTFEEYQEQAYEGGHTVYGQWTLAAFQTCFRELAGALAQPAAQRQHDTHTRPPVTPEEELRLRTNMAARV